MLATDASTIQDYGIYDRRRRGSVAPYARTVTKAVCNAIYGASFTVPDLPSTHEASHFIRVDRLEKSLLSYLQLEHGWDGYDGVPANNQGLRDAFSFISKLPIQAAIPKAMLSGSGEISLYWEEDGYYAEASFPGDNSYHFIVDAPNKTIAIDDQDPNADAIPEEIISAIGSIYS